MPRVSTRACVVCGLRDARVLSTTTLGSGERVAVCGSHDLAHRRAARPAMSLDELRGLTRDRRGRDRRGVAGDELGHALARAFAGERRSAGDRRD